MGLENDLSYDEVMAEIEEPMEKLASAIAEQVVSVNGAPPSALFLAGGGSKLNGLKERVAEKLNMDEKRVAVAGNNFAKSAYADTIKLDNPEYTTPLGIAVSAGMGLLNDSYVVLLNGQPAKLFRSGVMTLRDILLMNGYTYADMLGRTGKSLTLTLDGRHVVLRGEPAMPAVLTVNGEDAVLSAVVHAGDKVNFVPARGGADAHQTLGELLPEFTGRALVNNQDAGPDTALQNGDVILTLTRPAEVRAAEEKVAAPVAVAEPETPVTETLPVIPVESPAVEEKPEIPVTPVAPVTPMAPTAPVMTASPASGPMEITLNGEPLSLPGKGNGLPYYMMDLLQFSGLDLDHLDGPVRLEVNGEECGFRYVIKPRDCVTICYA